MHYELITYPMHFEVIDHLQNRLRIVETKSLLTARRERDRLNREDYKRIARRAVEKRDAQYMLELAQDPLVPGNSTAAKRARRAFHMVRAIDLADALGAA